MAHTVTWDATYEADPVDSDQAKLLGDDVRDVKRDVRERMELDHYWEADGNPTTENWGGFHRFLTMVEQAAKPTAAGNRGYVYTLDDGGDTELYYQDDGGTEIQLTKDGEINGAALEDLFIKIAGDTMTGTLNFDKSLKLTMDDAADVERDLIYNDGSDVTQVGDILNSGVTLNVSAATELLIKIGAAAATKIWHEDNDGDASGLDADLVHAVDGGFLLRMDSDSGYFESAEVAIAINSNHATAHSLVTVPRLHQVVMRCKVADKGYSIDDEVDLSSISGDTGSSVNNARPQSSVDDTNIFVSTPGDISGPQSGMVVNIKGGGSPGTILPTSWRFVMRAWK